MYNEISWPCPICGYATGVCETVKHNKYIIRKRRCKKNPEHRNDTIEIRKVDIPEIEMALAELEEDADE